MHAIAHGSVSAGLLGVTGYYPVTRWDTRDELGREVLVMPTDQTEDLSVQHNWDTDQERMILPSV
jgi:hypothetical protein